MQFEVILTLSPWVLFCNSSLGMLEIDALSVEATSNSKSTPNADGGWQIPLRMPLQAQPWI